MVIGELIIATIKNSRVKLPKKIPIAQDNVG
jgi:hypothetical protein